MNLLDMFQERLNDMFSRCSSIAVAYHPDADGIGAAKILFDHLTGRGMEPENIRYYPVTDNSRYFSDRQEAEVLKWGPDVALILDLCSNVPGERICNLKPKVQFTLGIDHHSFIDGWDKNFDFYINSHLFPELLNPQVHCAAKLMNTLFFTGRHDWVEIVGREADVSIPSMHGSITWEASQVLNLLGLAYRVDEDEETMTNRCNRLLACFIKSDSVFKFLENFRKERDLVQMYDRIQTDIRANVNQVCNIEKPYKEFIEEGIYVHHIQAVSGYEIIGNILKDHFPYRKKGSTYLFIQPEQMADSYQVFISTGHTRVNCFKIARAGGGGGHIERAGYRYRGPNIHGEIDRVCDIVEEMMKRH